MVNPTPVSPTFGARVRRFLVELIIGGAIAFTVWAAVGPGLIGWWYQPPSKDAFSCAGSVREALHSFVQFQFIAAAIGAVVTMVLVRLTTGWWRSRRALSAARVAGPTPAAPPPQTPNAS